MEELKGQKKALHLAAFCYMIAETARDLGNSLLLNQGFEELTKKSLLARFIKLFPSLQSLVSGESETKDEQFLVSRESYERKRTEYETIVSKKIPENSKAIATAREHGDLKENSEYKMAKQDQQVLMAQKTLLERDLGREVQVPRGGDGERGRHGTQLAKQDHAGEQHDHRTRRQTGMERHEETDRRRREGHRRGDEGRVHQHTDRASRRLSL